MPPLCKYYGSKGSRCYLEHRLKSLDVFLLARSHQPVALVGFAANQLASKSGDGANAIKLWEENKRDELASAWTTCFSPRVVAAAPSRMGSARSGAVYAPLPAVYATRAARRELLHGLSPPPGAEFDGDVTADDACDALWSAAPRRRDGLYN